MYELKEQYIIDFSNVKYYLDMHHAIQKALDFPDYYGQNW
ncbi:MAG: barstar family protein, partial [Clostridia bacterium]|nr:barstar family protein [Clostridia bacterium]